MGTEFPGVGIQLFTCLANWFPKQKGFGLYPAQLPSWLPTPEISWPNSIWSGLQENTTPASRVELFTHLYELNLISNNEKQTLIKDKPHAGPVYKIFQLYFRGKWIFSRGDLECKRVIMALTALETQMYEHKKVRLFWGWRKEGKRKKKKMWRADKSLRPQGLESYHSALNPCGLK